ncbi:hydroxymethylbilane synthase [Sphingomonas sp. 28-63-12]|uniref:hydroxymethylbilane synthase n=1 Tax=Sphingomonas sp. 28-63-12 TaxID=1970434 RepID=UPI0035A8C5D8
MTRPKLRLGTRGSPLALTQARMVREALMITHGLAETDIEIVVIKTTGDQVQDRALAEIGGKALWTKELDRAILSADIDLAVHSMKDVETIRPDGIVISAMLPRADVRDRIIGPESIDALPQGATVGTSSPRRQAQLLRLRPDLKIVLLRGNVDTRLAKVASGEIDATLLAAAGLDRLGRRDVGRGIAIDVMLPAPAQGAVGIETRAADSATTALIAAISHGPTMACVVAERALLLALNADCHSPLAALAEIDGKHLHLRAELFAADGSAHVVGEARGTTDNLDFAGWLATDLLSRAPGAVRALFGA